MVEDLNNLQINEELIALSTARYKDIQNQNPNPSEENKGYPEDFFEHAGDVINAYLGEGAYRSTDVDQVINDLFSVMIACRFDTNTREHDPMALKNYKAAYNQIITPLANKLKLTDPFAELILAEFERLKKQYGNFALLKEGLNEGEVDPVGLEDRIKMRKMIGITL